MRRSYAMGVAALAAGSVVLTACGSSTSSSSPSSSSAPTSSSAPSASSSSSTAPAISISSFNLKYSAMSALSSLASKGKGKIEVILPDTQSSTRYTTEDAPDLAKAFQTAGLTSAQYTIQNAQGSDATMLNDAQAAITNGASVILLDALDSTVGAEVESYAQQHGVKVIDYDRLTLKGHESYYVSFGNVQVGKLIGKGLQQCITAWNVKSPKVYELDGSPTDNNATLFAQGYNSVLKPLYAAGTYTKVGEQAVPGWSVSQAQTMFQQEYQAHHSINAVAVANDEMNAEVVNVLKAEHVPPKTIPTTGQDATVPGLQNILSGYQCMTVFKPVFQEAQAAAALAIYLRAGQKPPAGLVNGSSNDTTGNVPSVLLNPTSVNSSNMESTVVKDGAVSVSALCAASFASVCSKNGIH